MIITESINNLCLLAADDNEAAFESIFKLYYIRLLQFTETILKKREDAEEVVEDVFIKLWGSRKTLPAIKNLNYYLFVSVKHGAFNHLEKNKKHLNINIDELALDFCESSFNPEQSMISAEVLQQIQTSINALPPRCKLIFKLIKEDGLKYKEVASLLSISIKTIEAQMTLALGKIGNSLVAQHKTSKQANQ